MALRAIDQLQLERGIPRAELTAAINTLLAANGDPSATVFFRALIPQVTGYKAAWSALAAHLLENREAISAALASIHEADAVEECINYINRVRIDARKLLLGMGIEIASPYDRAVILAFEKSCQCVDIRPAAITFDAIQTWLQRLYDEKGVAADVLRELQNLVRSVDTPTGNFLASCLDQVAPASAHRFLKKRGVQVHNAAAARRKGQLKPGDQERGVLSRRMGIQRYCGLSREEKEKRWAHLAGLRHFPYAGRRKDIVDCEGHHPYIMSIYAANLARQMSQEGHKWLYRPNALHLQTAGKEGESERSLLFEPDFYLPEEDRYLVVIADRRQDGTGTMEDRMAWVEQVRSLCPDFKIEIILSTSLESGLEQVRLRAAGVELAPLNIQTAPERFKLDACPCARCSQGGKAHKAKISK